jgi:hypothetical protein
VTSPSCFGSSPDIVYSTTPEEEENGKMGIKQLFSIIKDEAPDAIKEGDIKNHFGRKIAIVGDTKLLSNLLLANFS